MALEFHLIFITVELILFIGTLWLYIKQLRKKVEPSTSSTTKFTPNDYGDYLKSKTWEELRQQAVTRANEQCELCKGPYDVVYHIKHPPTYEEDDLGNLLVVCGRCYGKRDGSLNQQEVEAKKIPPVWQQTVTTVQAPLFNPQPATAVQAPLFNPQLARSFDTKPDKLLEEYGESVFSEEVVSSGRAFFFDVYPISKQERMLVIVEDRERGHKPFGHYRLSISEVSVLEFDRSFRETLDALRVLTTKDKKDLFTKKVVTDNSSYFIDAKMASNGRAYLKITESKRTEQNTFERRYIMMFKEDFELFAAGLKKAISFLLKMEVV